MPDDGIYDWESPQGPGRHAPPPARQGSPRPRPHDARPPLQGASRPTRQQVQRNLARPRQPQSLSRRVFLRRVAVAGGVVAAGAVGVGLYEALAGSSAKPKVAAAAKQATTTTAATGSTTRTAQGVVVPTSPAIVAENAKTGTAWWVTTPQQPGDIEGYADKVSAQRGETVTLFVNTKAPHFHVEAYRMGYYQGIGARRVWQSDEVAGARQPPPAIVPPNNMIECQWAPAMSFTVGKSWPPGSYLLKLVGPDAEQQFVPLCVRDDSSKAAVVIMSSVTTWQAYNRWGGYSLYYGNRGGVLSYVHDPTNSDYASRSRIVSFDRPYDHDWGSGSADLTGNELPVIFQAERLGMDVTYWTDVDLHARPQLLANHRALLSLGHDEYWSTPMRQGAADALAKGVNFAFLGANACYRQIRFQSSSLGANRQQICYKDASEDPLFGVNNALVTVNWPDAPLDQPESLLIGSMYQDVGAQADMAVMDASSWLLAGTDLGQGARLAGVVFGEFDRYVPGGPGPTNVDVVAHSLVANRGGNYSDVTWYTVPGGGGVFASGNASWVGNLVDAPLIPPNVLPEPNRANSDPMLRIMENLYGVIAMGPANATRPSQGNWKEAYASTPTIARPAQNNAA